MQSFRKHLNASRAVCWRVHPQQQQRLLKRPAHYKPEAPHCLLHHTRARPKFPPRHFETQQNLDFVTIVSRRTSPSYTMWHMWSVVCATQARPGTWLEDQAPSPMYIGKLSSQQEEPPRKRCGLLSTGSPRRVRWWPQSVESPSLLQARRFSRRRRRRKKCGESFIVAGKKMLEVEEEKK